MATRIFRNKSKMIRTWVFYYINSNSANLHVIGTFDCKQPERTNMHKGLYKQWKSKEDVTGIGFTTDLSDPFFVWPQSPINAKP